jgi:hypothetical protein
VTAQQHRTTGMVAFIVCALYNGLALAWYDAQVARHRVRQFRPVCTLLGHVYGPDLGVCTRTHCTTRFDRVRDGARPR